jgi:hypothetical protein
MGEVVNVSFSPKTTDGGKARILNRRARTSPESVFPRFHYHDLAMDHADPEDNGMPSDVAYSALPTDCG